MLTATTVSTTQHDSIITQKRFLAKWKLTGKMFFLEILKAAIQGQRGREVCTFSSVALIEKNIRRWRHTYENKYSLLNSPQRFLFEFKDGGQRKLRIYKIKSSKIICVGTRVEQMNYLSLPNAILRCEHLLRVSSASVTGSLK